MLEHYNDLPIAGVAHFFIEAIGIEEQQRKLREKKLISEFNPTGNKTSTAGHDAAPKVPFDVQFVTTG
jgi:hypothetical protein